MTVYLMSHVSRYVGVTVGLLGLLAFSGNAAADPTSTAAGAGQASGPVAALPSARRVRLETMVRHGSGYVAQMDNGARAELTLEPRLQEAAEEVLNVFQIPYGAAVVVSIPDGRVLALAGRSSVAPELGPEELALQAWAPAASVFKIVSAAALVSEGGLTADSPACYHGGVSSVLADNLIDIPRIDRCATLGYGLGKSQNAILAKLATRHLTPARLEQVGRAFGFGKDIPFEIPVERSHLDVPQEQLEFARTAAGFWHSTLSPLHGALLAAAIGNGGEMPAPRIVERAFGSEGQPIYLPVAPGHTVLAPAAAREVGRMMEMTTRMGTAKGTFNDRKGRPLLPVSVAGKTGTLSAETDKGYLGYSWFVGYAPAEHPQIAFGVALGNRANWRIKATYVARRLVTEYLALSREGRPVHVLATARSTSQTLPR
jgi:peptidoglycan glycosyltransferase